MVIITPCGTTERKLNVCVGSITMLTICAVALAVNGGLYAGTIAFSAYKTAEIEKTVTLFHDAGLIDLV